MVQPLKFGKGYVIPPYFIMDAITYACLDLS